MKPSRNLQSRILLLIAALSSLLAVAGCDSNPGGLSDEQKLEGARKARGQQMQQQAGNMPSNRNALPGAPSGG